MIVLVLCFWHNMPIDLADTLIQKKCYLCINGHGLKIFWCFASDWYPSFIFSQQEPRECCLTHLSLLAVPCHIIHCCAVPAYVVEETLLFKGNLKSVFETCFVLFFMHSSIVEGLTFLSFMPGVGVHRQYLYLMRFTLPRTLFPDAAAHTLYC